MLLGQVYTADDLGEFHLPLRQFYAQQLQRGEPFDWMPTLYHGLYVTGEGQLGPYHPVHLLLYKCLPLVVAFNLELILPYVVFGVGMVVWLRRVGFNRDASFATALLATCGSFFTLHFVHPNAVGVIAHLPWLLAAIHAMVSSNSRCGRVWASLALLTASQILLGYPQYVWYSGIAEGVYVCWLVAAEVHKVRILVGLAAAKLVGVLAGGIQLLPTLDALANSNRSRMGEEFFANGSLHPINLLQLVGPYLFTTRVAGQNTRELGLYVGAVPLVLAVWTLLNRRKLAAQTAWINFACILGLIGFCLALGGLSPFWSVLRSLPIVGSFRFPCRALVLVQFALLLLAAQALAELSRGAGERSRTPLWPVVLATCVAMLAKWRWPDHCSEWALVISGPMLFAGVANLVRIVERGSPLAWYALILFGVAEQTYYGRTLDDMSEHSTIAEFAAQTNAPPEKSVRIGYLRPSSESAGLRIGNRALVAGYARVDGYAGLEPRDATDNPTRQQLANWGADWICDAQGEWQKGMPAPRLAVTNGGGQLLGDKPGQIECEISASEPVTITITESFHPGWVAMCEGHVLPVVPNAANLISCTVPEGQHTVELTFQPKSLTYGRDCTCAGLALTLIGAIGFSRFGGKKTPFNNHENPSPTPHQDHA
jgi:hypothetical protein